ncbi:DnaJ-domain-containing protein [Zopfia rhizophila CBS 207.26]|uniref:DnaJ-domain-containing protein n=1 Tax=Zopfia rhizophila CBS 207.26 TaxID=1314779 RepID=A0A6A6EHL4_9PEZI|nr:DnaJ-domain-containing protein [Zopfia rhizophila CBS 207.26]
MGDSEKDLLEIAKTTSDDFYELLGVQFESIESDITRAYRKTSLKFHPDKNPGNQEAVDKFILCGIAKDILLSPKLKAEYDRNRLRKKERALQNELLDGKRRQMKEDLERREAGASTKRKRPDDLSEAEKLELKIRQLAEDGKRRRKEREEKLNKEKEEEEALFMEPSPEAETKPKTPGEVAEIDRTIKVRFVREGDASTWEKEKVSNMFSKFGKIDSVVMGKDKKVRLSGEKHRKVIAMVWIVYTSIVDAHKAVADGKGAFPALDSVTWANKEPELKSPMNTDFSAPSTPSSTPNKSFRASFTGGLGKGFGSAPGTPSFSFSPQTPSLQEVTMMRLKQAERRRLEEQIRQKEAEETTA